MSHTLIGSAIPIATLVSSPLSIFRLVGLLLLNMAILGVKGTRRNISKFSHELLIPCVLNQAVGSSDWLMSFSKLQLCIELCRFT
jgi:hypothetical protein